VNTRLFHYQRAEHNNNDIQKNDIQHNSKYNVMLSK
jgi:hypothetical protein